MIQHERGNEMADLSENERKVLKTFIDYGKPAGPKTISEESGIPKDDVSKAIKSLKAQDLIMSPKRCYYAPSDKAKKTL
jgi:DNA-binding MarR family transcriptional regulator